MTVDLVSTAPACTHHLRPIWDALPPEVRGGINPGGRFGKVAVVASYGDLTRLRGRGYAGIVLAEHGIGQSYSNGNSSYPGGRNRGAVGMFLSPNETAAAADRAAYPATRIEVVGDPRLDALPARDPGDGPVVAVSFDWDCHVAPETRSAFLEYRRVLPALARRFRVIGHGHPRLRIAPYWRRIGVEFVPSFDDVCRRADLYVCDNSSTIYEFAATGRPVVVLNARGYRRDIHHGLRFWEAATVGLNVDRPDDLGDIVDAALRPTAATERARVAAVDLAYARTSGAAAAAAAAVVDYARDL